MRVVLLMLVARVASADPALYEWNEGMRVRPADQLQLGTCAIDVTLRGAIADYEMRQVVRNQDPGDLAAVYDVELPAEAKLIGLSFDGAKGVPVTVDPPTDMVEAVEVLGADPAIAMRTDIVDGRARYRVITQPIRGEHEIAIGLRWTQVADIHDGAIHAKVPHRIDSSTCLVHGHALPGPGVTVKKITASLPVVGPDDVTVDAVIDIPGGKPVAWLQTADAGEGVTARALTVLAPPVRTESGPHRALFVIDTSHSMELVGRNNVRRLVTAITSALPEGSDIEAVLYDRIAERALGKWQPADIAAKTIDQALASHGAQNGSDLVAALGVAKIALAEGNAQRGQPLVIVISDGVLGGVSGDALARALGGRTETLDVHSLLLDPHGMSAPDADALRLLVTAYGGTNDEVSIDNLDAEITDIATWLRPGWVGLELSGMTAVIPDEVRAGTGFVAMSLGSKPSRVTLRARGDAAVTLAASSLGAAPIAQLALVHTEDLGDDSESLRAKLAHKNPAVDDVHDLAVLSTTGRVAAQRRQMVAGGGPYTRMIALRDPVFQPTVHVGTATRAGGSALDRTIIKRLLVDQLQPHSYSCYARSLGRMISLAGTASFAIEIGRGEVSHVTVTGFEDNAEFHTCLVEAAYGMAPPQPTPGFNIDDRSIVDYTLTFSLRDKKPSVAAGADAAVSPQNDALPGKPPKMNAGDTSTPLGGLKP